MVLQFLSHLFFYYNRKTNVFFLYLFYEKMIILVRSIAKTIDISPGTLFTSAHIMLIFYTFKLRYRRH